MNWFLQLKVFLFLVLWSIENMCSARKTCPTHVSTALISSNSHALFYVDEKRGDDRWEGTIVNPNAAENNGPFRTIAGAIKGIRKQKRKIRRKPKVLYVRKGTYYVNNRIVLHGKDSNLQIIGYPNEGRPLVSGALKIPGSAFRRVYRNIWAAPYTGRCSLQVFLGKKRLVRARKPNLKSWKGNELSGEGPYLTIKDLLVSTRFCNRAGTGGFKQRCPSRNRFGFVFHEGDINPDWAKKYSTGNILVFHAWTAERGYIKSITAKNEIIFSHPLRKPVGNSPKPSGWRYIVENVQDELDSVGEFFCDQRKRMIYLIPPDGALDTEDVFIAQTTGFFKSIAVSNLRFESLNFAYTQNNRNQGYNPRPAALEFSKCNKIHINNCTLRNIACTGVYMGYTINSKITNSKFLDIGYYGISTEFRKNPKNKFATKNILIQGNTLKGCGITYMLQPSCMFVQGIRNITIINNDVSKTPYAAIRAGWQPTFSYHYLPKGEYVFTISHNRIYNYGQTILNDFAGVYISSNKYCGRGELKASNCHLPSLVSHNVVFGSSSYDYGAYGIRGDTAVSSLIVKDNWIYNTGSAEINFHCGQYNRAVNNMIYHTNSHGVFGTCHTMGGRSLLPKQKLSFKKNVIYVANKEALMFDEDDFWTKKVPTVNQTNYYFEQDNLPRFDIFFPKFRSWDEWKSETGNDKNSLIADPLFSNINARDFRLNKSSPAFKIGIRSIDLRKVQSESGVCVHHKSSSKNKQLPTTMQH